MHSRSTATACFVAASLLGASLLSAGSAPCFATDIQEPTGAAVEQVVSIVKPALVRIHVVSTRYWEGREQKYESSGSGVMITKEGHVITNHHVAGHATRLVCTLSNKEEIPAKLIGTDAGTDIAIIQLLPAEKREFPVVTFGDSSLVKEGDPVLALGSPLALAQSVTLGIVSNSEMIMPSRRFGRFEQDGENVGALVRWITHDADIYPGNSGGPLVNIKGEIIGINEISVGGIGGAIPGNLARDVANALMKDGRVKRSWVGVTVQPLLKHGPIDRGVLVTNTFAGSPAAAAGIETGDVILNLDGHDITVKFEEQLPEFNLIAANLPIGATVPATLWRNGEEKSVEILTIEREDARPKEREVRQWGLTVSDISFIQAREMKRDDQEGVLITSVRPGGPAGDAKPAIQERDVLVAVNDTAVRNVQELADLTRSLTENETEPVAVLAKFDRDAGTFVTVVKVGIREINDPGLEVKKAWLPVETQVLTRDIAGQLGNEDLRGFRVTQVFAGSTAETAGLQVGDLIVAVDDEPLTATALEHYEELPSMIRNYSVGTEAELSILRNGESMRLPVELARAPQLDREMRKYRDEIFEFTVREIAFLDRANRRWKQSQQGMLVEEVKPGGWAAIGELNVNDLIMEIHGESVTTVEAIEEVMDRVANDEPASVVIKVLRGIYTVYLEIEPQWDDA